MSDEILPCIKYATCGVEGCDNDGFAIRRVNGHLKAVCKDHAEELEK